MKKIILVKNDCDNFFIVLKSSDKEITQETINYIQELFVEYFNEHCGFSFDSIEYVEDIIKDEGLTFERFEPDFCMNLENY